MPRPKSITNDKLLDIALEVIQRVGPESFTLQDISDEASLSPATLLQRFNSKAELLKRVILHSKKQLKENLSNIADTMQEKPQEALVEWLLFLAKPLNQREVFASHLFVLKQDILDDEMHVHSKQYSHLVQKNIQTYLSQMEPKMDESALKNWAKMIEAHWHGLLWQWALSGEGELEPWLREGLLLLLSYNPPKNGTNGEESSE